MAPNNESKSEQIRSAFEAASDEGLPSSLVGDGPDSFSFLGECRIEAGEMQHGEVDDLPHSPAAGRNETGRVAGKNSGFTSMRIEQPEANSASASAGHPSTKQLRVRLPRDYAASLLKLPKSLRADAFMIMVFGQIGNVYAPVDFFAGFEVLQRVGVLLRYSLQGLHPGELLSRVKGAIKTIDQVCRSRRVGYVSVRVRLPRDYADALLTLSAPERGRIIRMTVSANAASICMEQLVRKARVLQDIGKRLMDKLALGEPDSPEAEIQKVLDLISCLYSDPAKGGRP